MNFHFRNKTSTHQSPGSCYLCHLTIS